MSAEPKRHWLKWIFMLAGVGVMTARTGQQGGIYLFLFLVPLLAGAYERQPSPLLLKTGFVSWLLYVVFAVLDGIHWSFSGEAYRLHFDILTKGKLSSLLGMTGVLWMLLGRDLLPVRSRVRFDDKTLFACFWDGVWIGSLLLVVLGVYQFLTGFDFVASNSYRPDRLLASGFHRATGLSNHPLSLAGMSLGVMVAAAALAMAPVAWTGLDLEKGVFARVPVSWRGKFWMIAASHGLMVVFSGSRTPTAIAMGAAGIILMVTAWRHRRNMPVQALTGLTAVGGALVFWRLGIGARFSEALQSGMGGDQRLFFWKAHWHLFMQSPWFGHGRQFLETVARDRVYLELFSGQEVVHYNAHNLYLEVLAMGGIIGFIVLAGLWGIFILGLRHISSRSEFGPVVFRAWCLAFAANLVHGLTQNSLFDSAAIAPYVYLAWILALMMLWRREPASI